MEAIRVHADDFSFWQRTDKIGRPAYDERTVLIAFLVQQLLGLTFRETGGLLTMLAVYFELDDVPDNSVLYKRTPADARRRCGSGSSLTSWNDCRDGRSRPPSKDTKIIRQ
jgi:hypothetical protein